MRRVSLLPDRKPKGKKRAERKRRPAPPAWLRPVMVWSSAAVMLAAAVGGAWWFWSSGRAVAEYERARAVLIAASADAGLAVRDVYVVGRSATAREALLAALDLKIGTPMVSVDPDAARQRVEALSWVRAAVVERRFPGTVVVRIEERAPLALWQRGGRLVVVDGDGAVIDEAAIERFAHLPVIVGDDAPTHAPGLLAVMASEPGLSGRVRAAVRVGGRRWNLRLDNDIDVELPEDGVAEAWRRLARFEREHDLLASDITAIDLRLPDRVVVRQARPGAGGGENT